MFKQIPSWQLYAGAGFLFPVVFFTLAGGPLWQAILTVLGVAVFVMALIWLGRFSPF